MEENLQEKINEKEDLEPQLSSSDTQKSLGPWSTSVHEQKTAEDIRPSQMEELEEQPRQELRRSTKVRRPNPKYIDAALAEEVNNLKPIAHEDACKSERWQKARKEIQGLKQNEDFG
uniref:Uncharacterized protein n=1 Tax=Nelumbo nucifera TaxID=4432 RepID=A0A822YDL3_NELNU|nr:TPA_asm: hypothetical protein HUJ06_031701 [Nelumbo nucifera]DAD30241.1 TPA_asm: hypothetical protein HUJ06_031709 [Nelumbo nucifera]DAD30243.1 TPA_asm: hypothetical protein HUJ06_031711 [Nelumbo nucifera]DAD30260.1 TPA_asm: hypothetical protein HUJ06_031728 [Nelumbo nucifera]DAD30262.1 TPA_asm: hypothetical protein HUJ06_031730 [Nelumbo nucifera]